MKKKIPGINADRIKHELFKRIAEYHDILQERADIESDNPGASDTDLCESNDEYACVSRKTILIEEEIEKLMLETKYVPLMNLNEKQLKELGHFEASSGLAFEVNIEEHLDGLLNELKLEMRSRIKKIKPLRMVTRLDAEARGIYREIIKCYIYGNLAASCALCRSLAEYLTKKLIDFMGYGDYLDGGEEGSKESSLPDILAEYELVSDKTIEQFIDIYRKGSAILHGRNVVKDENEVMDLIRKLQVFIKEITQVRNK